MANPKRKQPTPRSGFTITVPWSVRFVIVLIGLVAWVFYLYIVPEHSGAPILTPPSAVLVFDKTLAIVAGCVTAYAAVYASMYTRVRLDSIGVELRAERLKRTFDLLHYLDGEKRYDTRSKIYDAFHNREPPINQEDVKDVEKALAENNNELGSAIDQTMGTLEDFALAIIHEYIDEGLAYESMGAVVANFQKWLRHWFVKERETNKTLYINFHHLAERWAEGKSAVHKDEDIPAPDTAFKDLAEQHAPRHG